MKKLIYLISAIITLITGAIIGEVLIGQAAPSYIIQRTILPEADDTYNLGTSTRKWANIYAGTYYGDGSNLTGISGVGGGVSTSTPFSAGYIPYATSSLAITNSAIFQSDGNIGIATTTPSALLSVGATAGSQFLVNSSGVITQGIWNGTDIDFSDYTNATVSSPITLTGDAIGFDSSAVTSLPNLSSIGTITTGVWQGTDIDFSSKVNATAGTGINFVGDEINNSGVLSLSATSPLQVSSATGTSAISFVNPSAQGQLIMASGTTAVAWGSLVAGSNITLTTSTPGEITVNSTTTPTFSSITFSGDSTKISTGYKDIGFNVLNATTSATATTTIQKKFYQAITISQIDCSTNGSNITIGADERASSAPNTAGTDVFSGGSLVCDSDGATTSTFSNATIAAGALLNFDIDSTANSTTTLRVYVKYHND